MFFVNYMIRAFFVTKFLKRADFPFPFFLDTSTYDISTTTHMRKMPTLHSAACRWFQSLFPFELFSFFFRKYVANSPDSPRKQQLEHQQQRQQTPTMAPSSLHMRRVANSSEYTLMLFTNDMPAQTIENLPNSRFKQTCVKSSKCA